LPSGAERSGGKGVKTIATILAETRRDVPQALGLIRTSGNDQDILRQHRDLDWLEIRYGIQFSKRLAIEGLSGARRVAAVGATEKA
jgi:hypothetical protein